MQNASQKKKSLLEIVCSETDNDRYCFDRKIKVTLYKEFLDPPSKAIGLHTHALIMHFTIHIQKNLMNFVGFFTFCAN